MNAVDMNMYPIRCKFGEFGELCSILGVHVDLG